MCRLHYLKLSFRIMSCVWHYRQLTFTKLYQPLATEVWVVDKSDNGTDFSPATSLFPVTAIAPVLHTHSDIHHQ